MFYKYCPIYNHKDLQNEWSITNLLNNQVKFSSRRIFNDLFDSQVEFIKPTKKQLKPLHSRIQDKGLKDQFNRKFLRQSNRNQYYKDFLERINIMFDSYMIYCVTSDPENNLMWAHYSSNHTGFCIEWNNGVLPVAPVKYKKTIAKFELLDMIKSEYSIDKTGHIGEQIYDALMVKLEDWGYEKEYRMILSRESNHLISKQFEDFAMVEFQPEWINSIIWGCRTPKETRDYIKSKMPSFVRYKRVQVNTSSLSIVKC